MQLEGIASLHHFYAPLFFVSSSEIYAAFRSAQKQLEFRIDFIYYHHIIAVM